MGGYFERNPMTNKIKKFLYTLEHLILDGYDEIPTFALYHPLLLLYAMTTRSFHSKTYNQHIHTSIMLLRPFENMKYNIMATILFLRKV